MGKENNSTILARIDERVKNIVEKLNELSIHVNEELSNMDKRVKILEVHDIEAKTERRTTRIVVVTAVSILGAIATLLSIFSLLHII